MAEKCFTSSEVFFGKFLLGPFGMTEIFGFSYMDRESFKWLSYTKYVTKISQSDRGGSREGCNINEGELKVIIYQIITAFMLCSTLYPSLEAVYVRTSLKNETL